MSASDEKSAAVLVLVVAKAVAATATAAAAIVVIVRHVFPERSIFTWHSMPLALTFFLSFFHIFSFLRPILYWWRLGHFLCVPFPFALIPFYSGCAHSNITSNSKWIVYVFVWIGSHKWRATCDLLSLNLFGCVGVCVIEQQHSNDFRYTHINTDTHTYKHTVARTTISQHQITPKRRWKW